MGFSAYHDSFGLASAAGEIALAGAAVLAQMSDWSPHLRRLVERADTSSLSSFAVKSSVPVAPWATSGHAPGRRAAQHDSIPRHRR